MNFFRRIIRFNSHQLLQIKKWGSPIIWRKTPEFFSLLVEIISLVLLAPLIVPLVLLIRLLRPLVLIRFGRLIASRIGHLAFEPELYLVEKDLGKQDNRACDIFYFFLKPICNHQLKKMLDRTLRVCNPVGLIDRTNHLLPGYEKHVVPLRSLRHEDVEGLINRTKPHLSFLSDEESKGVAFLEKMGVPGGVPFICFINRDSAYLKARFRSDFSYHDYRDSHIKNYLPAAEELAKRGYYLIRMGAVVKEAVNSTNVRIIDYATNHRTDFMDIYLFAKCRFLIAANFGPYSVSWIFKRPIVFVNVAPLLQMIVGNHLTDLYIPKKYWIIEEKRFMTCREIIGAGVGNFYETRKFKAHGIELIENSPEEIYALAVEMDERLKGTWKASGEDDELQNRFQALLMSGGFKPTFRARIGTEFLRQNQDWLE